MRQTSSRHYGKAILLSFVFLLLTLAALSVYNGLVKKARFAAIGTVTPGYAFTDCSATAWPEEVNLDGNFLAGGTTNRSAQPK